MGFFDSLPPPPPPEPEPPAPPRPPWMRSDTELGGTIAWQAVLARSARAAVAVSALIAYPNGFQFRIIAALSEEDHRGSVFHSNFDSSGDGPPTPEFMRVGVQFADGGVASNLGGPQPFGRAGELDGPLLMREGGGGGGRRWDMRYWMAPLPPPGPVTFVIAWPAYGIGESRTTLDGEVIRTAATRAITLW